MAACRLKLHSNEVVVNRGALGWPGSCIKLEGLRALNTDRVSIFGARYISLVP